MSARGYALHSVCPQLPSPSIRSHSHRLLYTNGIVSAVRKISPYVSYLDGLRGCRVSIDRSAYDDNAAVIFIPFR